MQMIKVPASLAPDVAPTVAVPLPLSEKVTPLGSDDGVHSGWLPIAANAVLVNIGGG